MECIDEVPALEILYHKIDIYCKKCQDESYAQLDPGGKSAMEQERE